MNAKRLIPAMLLACALAPGLFVRSSSAPPNPSAAVMVRPIDFEAVEVGPFRLLGVWELSSENGYFGGYSALIPWQGDRLLAAGDTGRLLIIPRPDISSEAPIVGTFPGFTRADKMLADVESLTVDPKSGQLWAGLEWAQMIVRFRADLSYDRFTRPEAMADWGENSGPESLARLADGRFLVIEEQALDDHSGEHEALLFPGDPLDGMAPVRFRIEGREGFRPSDALALDDGRLLVLMRRVTFGLPPHFDARVLVADSHEIEAGGLLHTRTLADIESPLPTDNFEGMALVPDPQGGNALWIISDDNFMYYQRTLLLKLRWNERQKARE